MGKKVDDSVLDASLDKTATSIMMRLVDAEPADRAAAVAATLGNVVLDSGDFTKANGDTSGRKVTVAAQTAVPITVSGNVNHVCLDDGTTLLLVTTTTAQVAVTNGGTADVGAFKQEIADPT